jgi:hypothetical protein
MDGLILTEDPGASPGYALWSKTGGLISVSSHICAAIVSSPIGLHVIEIPTVYPRSPVDPNSLITLAVTAGISIGRLNAAKVLRVAPRTWKGQVPTCKSASLAPSEKRTRTNFDGCCISHNRMRAAMSTEERAIFAPFAQNHNILDAIGIGQWYFRCVA